MTTSLVQKARDNRIAALAQLAQRKSSNVLSLDEARARREQTMTTQVVFASRRAA